MTDKNNLQMNIDLSTLQQTIRSAINEAGIYAGFTYNVKIDKNFINYELVKDSSIQFVPITTDNAAIEEYKECFYSWVIKNAFKYVVDRFSIFLDQIYYVCLLYSSHGNKYTKELVESLENKKKIFHKMNFSDKLTTLDKEFQVFPLKNDYLLSIQTTRNCLTHRDGVIGTLDLKSNKEFTVNWTGFHIYGVDPDGNEVDLNTIPAGGVVLPGNTNVMLKQHAEKNKKFKRGERIHFTSKEFAEILLYLKNEADYMLNCALKFSEKMGVPKKDEPT